ncbi:MAG: hypothetical protein KF841_12490 [Phycisphaerae bacterium]|nr:hypothetical protein [Phycisphaerae bacterium]
MKTPEVTANPSDSLLQPPPARAKGRKRKPDATTVFSPDEAVQRRATAEANQARIRRAGIESRLLGHVSSSGRRAQGRRDSRNK